MFMCVVNLKTVNKLDLTWKQSFLIPGITQHNDTQHNDTQHMRFSITTLSTKGLIMTL
jgi:hypothetical protein